MEENKGDHPNYITALKDYMWYKKCHSSILVSIIQCQLKNGFSLLLMSVPSVTSPLVSKFFCHQFAHKYTYKELVYVILCEQKGVNKIHV